MSPNCDLEIPYRLNSRIVSKIKSAETVVIFGTGEPLELPLALFQVLAVFAESTTVQQAFQRLNVDVGLDEFATIISDFIGHGLLQSEQPVDDEPGLGDLLKRRAFCDAALINKIGGWMRQGRAILIPDALPPDFAEAVHRDLYGSDRWSVFEGGHGFFHARSSVMSDLEAGSSALTACSRLFKSTATRRFITELSGQNCAGESNVTATWYRPGEYALPHDDVSASNARSVAYIWYLTKDWRQEWGGALFWCPTGQYVRPQFNMLLMFAATPSNMHFICPVAQTATGKRLTVNGFWCRPERASPPASISPDAGLSPHAYGPRTPEDPELSSIVVL